MKARAASPPNLDECAIGMVFLVEECNHGDSPCMGTASHAWSSELQRSARALRFAVGAQGESVHEKWRPHKRAAVYARGGM